MKENPLLNLQEFGQSLWMGEYHPLVEEQLARFEKEGLSTRLWRKDPTLWIADPRNRESIRSGLGWLHVAEKMGEQLNPLSDFVSEVQAAGFRHVLHMGMGGSSLAPLAIQHIFSAAAKGIPLTVLDTTDPETILKIERQLPLSHTLFIVASKSGTTAENVAFGEYFYSKIKALKGARAGENFVAITDPGTPLVRLAEERRFRKIFLNFSDIGGRYSALSYFGLVPAALMGVDVAELLVRALRMEHASASCVPIRSNPGAALGAALGALARSGRDKATFILPEKMATLGMWLEQLIAESTGKEGIGILPVVGELPLSMPAYGEDRLFIDIHLRDDVDERRDREVADLKKAGHPVISLVLEDYLDVGQEFYRWQIATATAGAVLGVNPFDQPDVQATKENTNRFLDEVRKTGALPEPSPGPAEGPLLFYGAKGARTGRECLKAFVSQAVHGNYVALEAYLPETPETTRGLQAIRLRLRDGLHLATTLGYGPRFLHSTGQFHKGGPNTGLFLQLTADPKEDASIPGQPYTFGLFTKAQALGDFEALQRHGRRVLRIHLGKDTPEGLDAVSQIVETALALAG